MFSFLRKIHKNIREVLDEVNNTQSAFERHMSQAKSHTDIEMLERQWNRRVNSNDFFFGRSC